MVSNDANHTPKDAAANQRDSSSSKQAACLECRRSKVKCDRSTNATSCKKCLSASIECVVPEYHVGRYKGVKNKRSGLDKAIHQVEEAVKKARKGDGKIPNQHARALEKLLRTTKGTEDHSGQRRQSNVTIAEEHQQQSASDTPELAAESAGVVDSPPIQTFMRSDQQQSTDDITVNNANNPLQLLAIASAIPDQPQINSATMNNKVSPNTNTTTEDDETYNFFSPIISKLDTGPDLDPVDLGLVTLEEAGNLFEYFHNHLSHTRWGLDRTIHTANFVRSRSAYLFTSIMAAAALFLPHTPALSKRLLIHSRLLARRITSNGYRSLEIVLSFMVNVPWMQPGRSWAMDDETCYYLSTAMAIALDLSLNKIVTPSSTIRPQGIMDRVSHGDCIEAQRALNIDGFPDIDPDSVLGRRLLRARERVWLALFTLERGVCLARGRPWTVPTGPLIETCDAWHVSDLADPEDGSMTASCVLRRDFGSLVSSIRTTCDNHHFSIGEGSSIVKFMREKVEGFFARWYTTWSFQLRQQNGAIPPYVEILVSHGKLSAYCSVINHPTATSDVKQFFRAAGLTAALNVIRVAVENESRLRSMPNNSVIMVSFAACFVLGLSSTRHGDNVYLASTAKKSIEEAADVLERIGSSPPHRKGASALFGKHIKRIIKQHTTTRSSNNVADESLKQHATGPTAVTNGAGPFSYTLQPISEENQPTFPGFDSMTDDQLLEAIQNSKDDIDNFNTGWQAEDGLFMDWLDWPSIT